MTNDQRSIDGQALYGIGTIVRGSGAVLRYRGPRVAINKIMRQDDANCNHAGAEVVAAAALRSMNNE